jgi:hypothetical protein
MISLTVQQKAASVVFMAMMQAFLKTKWSQAFAQASIQQRSLLAKWPQCR